MTRRAIPRTLGPYVLKRPLGRGGVGQVYLAWKPNASPRPTVCVVKFPLPQYATDEKSRRRFLKEAMLSLQLGSHPNIVYVFDVALHRGSMPYMAMEYIDGIDLAALLKQTERSTTRLTLPSIHYILAGVAAGLHHAHTQATIDEVPLRIIHRDISPSNVLVSRDGAVKLVDFGLGVALPQGSGGQGWRGTLGYMSPEHLYANLCPEMDIYSLGIVAWELLENRPLRGQPQNADQVMSALLQGDVPEPSRGEPKLTSLIMSCLEKNPRMRPRADEFADMLAQCPGHTHDPAVLVQELTPLIGHRRSSGHSQESFAATADLMATLAAVRHQQEQGHQEPESPAEAEDLSVPETDAPVVVRGPRKEVRGIGPSARDFMHPVADAVAAEPSGFEHSEQAPSISSQAQTNEWPGRLSALSTNEAVTLPRCVASPSRFHQSSLSSGRGD